MNKVWLIGGTSDSAIIATVLADSDLPLVITVTTASAQALYNHQAEIIIGCMNLAAMVCFCQQHQIKAVVDASHPYATEVSLQAIAITNQLNIPYLRYERIHHQPLIQENVIELNSWEHLLAGDYLTAQRVLLTVGCQALPKFQSWQSRTTLFARVLPKISSLETAIASGFTSDRLIAIRPPISLATETALWQQWNISLVVTKASGKAGGEETKRKVAASLGIPLIVISRPQIIYPQQTSVIAEVLAFCQAIAFRGLKPN
ncbi:MAG: cobalt-precorrin-6A reductase [Pleurocapsa sp. SU_5_0]|nr:cobalt-precorrin-6A reductase [Pleurocapsa sp. SU_5_0]NJR45907.1 cobalt-precorrin-6A reductase [Hyellaceae cyanobacterium CSU_1_1]